MSRQLNRIVGLLFLLINVDALAANGNKSEHDKTGPAGVSSERPGFGGKKRGPADMECALAENPEPLVKFANGEGYDYGSLVSYLTSPGCEAVGGSVAIGAVGGVNFNEKGPFRLDNYAKLVRSQDLAATERVKVQLADKIGPLLRQYPLAPGELKPLVGQLAILSQPAGRTALVELIASDLYATSRELKLGDKDWQGNANALASRLVVMGIEEDSLVSGLGGYVQELAVLVQADSLASFFTALAGAAAVNRKVIPAFNLTAGALNSGVQARLSSYSTAEKAEMLKGVFSAIRAASASRANVEPGNADLNEAMESLLEGRGLSVTSLRRLWREILLVLVNGSSQPALADAFAESLTPNYLLLSEGERAALLKAAVNYGSVAQSLQKNFVLAWQKNWELLHRGKLKTVAFNEARSKTFEPLAEQLMELEPEHLDPLFVRELVMRSLIKDRTIEKRLPKIVLWEIKNRDRQTRSIASDATVEDSLQNFLSNLQMVWVLGRVYYPALFEWIDRHPD